MTRRVCLYAFVVGWSTMSMAQIGSVKTHLKISDAEGGFTGTFGFSVALLGDLDGDGVTELAVGAQADDGPTSHRGAVWVLFLNADGTVKVRQKISATEGGFTGVLDPFDFFGSSVTSLGDLDGDGVTDLAVGAVWDEDGGGRGHGAVWVLFLNADGTVKTHQKISATQGGFTGVLDGFDLFGSSVTSLGDLDGDGVTELAVGAHTDGDGGNGRGAVWMLFLNADGTVKAHQKISDTEGGFTGVLDNSDHFGWSVTSLGDFNGDGVIDLAVGASNDGDTDRGAVWMLFLNADGTVRTHQKISDTEGGFTGVLDDFDFFGSSVASLGDLDGDGVTELAVGARWDGDGDMRHGAVWVLFLQETTGGQPPAQLGRLTVNSTGDGSDSNPGDGVCSDGGGDCTLRAAIEEANVFAGSDTIYFHIPGPGPFAIRPGFALPTITDAVDIDGTTQPGFDGTPIIELDGSNTGPGASGLRITAGNTEVRGLVINRFDHDGISIDGNDGNVIAGNFIGTDVTGTVDLGNARNGVLVQGNASHNLIGGKTQRETNLISGNEFAGVNIIGGQWNRVLGNLIGTDVTGTAIIGNSVIGVTVQEFAANTEIGAGVGSGNVISGNGNGNEGGVTIISGAWSTRVLGNHIGTDITGITDLGNDGPGIFIAGDAGGSVIGARAAGNTIAFNRGDGVFVDSGTANGIRFNSIHSNAGLGIDLGPDGVTPNDAGDGDTGANKRQNFPVLREIYPGDTTISGTLDSRPDATFLIEFFVNHACDPSRHGEGETVLDSVYVTTDGGGSASFSVSLPAWLAPAQFITATATDDGNSTSEFCACIPSLTTSEESPDVTRTITTVAGNGSVGSSGDGGPATQASLEPAGVFVVRSNLYIADSGNNRIRKLDPSGIISTVAGNGAPGFSGDEGPAVQASLRGPVGVFVDGAGNLYIADSGNNRIRKVDPSGTITTVAGGGDTGYGSGGYSGDGGPATQARLSAPISVFVDGAGHLYIADRLNDRIRKVDPSGIITTVAGGRDSISAVGDTIVVDGGPATQATLALPEGVFVDGAGNLYFADTHLQRIRKVDPSGIISTVAGNGTPGFSGDGGPATSANLAFPTGVFVDGEGNLYIADTVNHRIRKVDPAGTITTVAGSGDIGYGGGGFSTDGVLATQARLNRPTGVFVDGLGNLYIADTFNKRVRRVEGIAAPTTLGDFVPDLVDTTVSTTVFKILSVADIPNDQGRQVRITWNKHPNDSFNTSTSILEYSVWRKIDHNLPAFRAKSLPDSTGSPAGRWDFITTVPAHQNDEYSGVVPTLADSTAISGVYYSVFFVQAHTAFPAVHYSTEPDSGYSVDNLEPHTPTGFSLTTSGLKGKLVWEHVPDLDFALYAVYRGSSPGFEPVAIYRTTIDTVFEDTIDDSYRFYRIAAFDFAGNRSQVSQALEVVLEIKGRLAGDFDRNEVVDLADFLLFSDAFGGTDPLYDLDVSGTVDLADFFLFAESFGKEDQAKLIALAQENIGLPIASRLEQNYPNPFNSTTTIRFILLVRSDGVGLAVYNLAGQKVATLMEGPREIGTYTLRWDGLDDGGRELASGVYLYRLTAGDRVATRKLLLLR